MIKPKGYVSFVLHAHLPFIHHPESENYLEEQWLFEAISETYLPLLINFQKLVEEQVDFRITMSMTPPLLNMLDNKLLQKRYIKYLKKHIELAKKETKRTTYDSRVNELSFYYLERYQNDLHLFHEVYHDNIIEGFKHFQDLGVLEIITCGATHGYFPILYVTEQTVKAQIAVGVQTYEKYFGRKPRGIWLPECGYVPEADKYLKEFGIEYVITESHGILYADPTPIYGTCSPIVSPTGITCFGRDMDKYGVLLMDILVILIIVNFIVILVMMLIMTILNLTLLIMVFVFILELNIIVLLAKIVKKIFMIYNGQKILVKNKLVTS